MADEISLTCKLTSTKSGVSVTNTVSTKTQSMASAAGYDTTATPVRGAIYKSHIEQNVGTSREAISIGDVDITNANGNEYFVTLVNKDATNYVTVEAQTGAATYATLGIMRPGEFFHARRPKLDGSGYLGVFVTANTAACRVEVVASEAGDPAA